MLPELHQRQDADEGYPLALLVEGERPSFDKLRSKIQKFGELRDPVEARSQYNETALLTVGKRVVAKGAVLQRGFNGTITAFGEFVSPSVRFNPTHTGKVLEISRSADPTHNQTVTIAQVSATSPTTAVIAPPLSADAGPLTWELREVAVEPLDRTIVEVTFGDTSAIAPGWLLFDGYAEYEVLARTQLDQRTEREGTDGILTGTSRNLTGTATVTAGETTVTGVGTQFLTEVVAGSYIKLASQQDLSFTKVAKVLSNTSLVLAGGYAGVSGAGSITYEFHQFSLATNSFTLEDIGKRVTLSGSSIVSNNDTYEIENVLKLVPLASSYQLATLRRLGPSDAALARTPIKSDAGPLIWALLARPQLALKGRSQVIRGLAEQFGYDAEITAIGPRAGAVASIAAVSAGLVTITGLTGMSPNDVGRFITISAATTTANNGTFRIAAFVSATSVKYTNASGVAPDANNGAIDWITLTDSQVELRMPSGRFSPDLSGTSASISTAVTVDGVRSVTITGLTGMEPSCVGQHLSISNAGSTGNNSVSPFVITQYLSANSVVYINALGVAPDANNGALAWVYNSPDRGKLLTLRGPGTNNGTVEVLAVSSTTTSITVAQRVIPQLGTPALPDLADPFTVDVGPMEWELRAQTTENGNAESPEHLQSLVRAPSLLQYLAKDYGIEVDIRETEDRQRSWVKNNSRWIGIKGLAKAYSILGDISGFSIVPEALYRVSQDMSLAIPAEYLHETGEYAVGRSAPSPASTVMDGTLAVVLGRTQFSAASAQFRPADVGLQLRIQQAANAFNNKLYTIDRWVNDTTVEFRVVDTMLGPEANNGSLQWHLTRLYTTKPPLRARFDDLDPELMGQLVNPTATLYFGGTTSAGDILYVSKVRGVLGTGIRVRHVATAFPLALSVVGTDIFVDFQAGVDTASSVSAAIAALPAAAALVEAIPQHGGGGNLAPHTITNLFGGEDHFALDKFCWEDAFDSSIDGLLPFRTNCTDPNGDVQYTQGVDGGFGVRITHNPVAASTALVTVVGSQVTVRYDPAATTAIGIANAFLANPDASALIVATAQGTGGGLFNPSGSKLINVVFTITSVIQTAENLWDVTISGPLNVVLDVQGGNWRVTDSDGIEFFLESVPVASGANWVTTAFSAVEPATGPIVLSYDCTTIFNCDYCAASKVLLTMEPSTIFNDSQNALSLELILNRMLGRIAQVTPAHVQTVLLFSSTFSASLNLLAEVETSLTSILPFVAPVQAYYDMIDGDVIPIDSLSLNAVAAGPYFTINVGAITAFAGVTATMSGFTGPIPNVIGQNLVVTGAATPANNGTFVITGYVSNDPGISTINYTNAAAVAGDANNGSIVAATTP